MTRVGDFSGRIPVPQPPEVYDVDMFNGENCYRIFNCALLAARAHATRLGYANLTVEGSGALARGMTASRNTDSMNPIELQNIFLHHGGEKRYIGHVLPEAVHLQRLKSPEQLCRELETLVNAFPLPHELRDYVPEPRYTWDV